MTRALAASAVCLALLAFTPVADAAQRYASPGGSGAVCSQAAPCSLKEAVTKAESDDEVIVGAGTYTSSEQLLTGEGVQRVNLHGDETGAMPRLIFNAHGTIGMIGTGNRIAYLDISNTEDSASGAICGFESRLERVRVSVVGEGSTGILVNPGCLVRDSLARAEGKLATALSAATAFPSSEQVGVARNVTAIASGPGSKGAASSCIAITPTGSETLNAKNLIAEGAEADLSTSSSGCAAKILISNSNFRSVSPPIPGFVVDLGGNQNAAPLFVNAAGGDYREATGSPTIDAGVADQLGSLDLAGNPRMFGPAPDIGAYEFVPPPPPPGQIQSLAVSPKAFRPVNAGEAIFSAKKKPKGPVGANVTFTLSGNAAVDFFVERKLSGRRAKGKCVKRTNANSTKKKCPLFKQLNGTFADSGRSGQNSFKFSGRIGGRALKPGSYSLVGSTSAARASASFRIVK